MYTTPSTAIPVKRRALPPQQGAGITQK